MHAHAPLERGFVTTPAVGGAGYFGQPAIPLASSYEIRATAALNARGLVASVPPGQISQFTGQRGQSRANASSQDGFPGGVPVSVPRGRGRGGSGYVSGGVPVSAPRGRGGGYVASHTHVSASFVPQPRGSSSVSFARASAVTSSVPRGEAAVARGSAFAARGGRGSYGPKLPKKRQFLGGLSSEPLGHFDGSTLNFIGAAPISSGQPSASADGSLALASQAPDTVSVDELQFLGSYSWIDSANPTIMVPGHPVIWQNVPTPFSALPDGQLNSKGTVFRDQNGARLPLVPLLPVFAAVDACLDATGSSFDWQGVDFISDRNGLRKLLRWIEGSSRLTDFRIEAEMVGSRTVLLGRWEERSVAAPPADSFGFGFERATTLSEEGCEHTTGYSRIVTYKLGELRLVTRCEVDACFPFEASHDSSGISPTERFIATGEKGLRVLPGGRVVPQASLIELKTKQHSLKMSADWREILPQLLLSGTPTLIRGVHTGGVFSRIITSTVGSEQLMDAEARAGAALSQLREVLSAVQAFLQKQRRGERFSLVCRRKDRVLQVFRRSTPSLIPEALRARFEVRM